MPTSGSIRRMAKARGTSTKSIAELVKTATSASAVNRRVGLDALALIRRRLVAISEAFFDIGVALRTLAQPRIYTAMGHQSFEALLVGEKLMSRSSAADLMRIAERYTRETAVGARAGQVAGAGALCGRNAGRRPGRAPGTR